jgi:hypothetical protein
VIVGWAKRSVPTVRNAVVDEWWARRWRAFAHPTTLAPLEGRVKGNHTGRAMEYFTWLSAKLDSIEATPSSRVSLFFRNAS